MTQKRYDWQCSQWKTCEHMHQHHPRSPPVQAVEVVLHTPLDYLWPLPCINCIWSYQKNYTLLFFQRHSRTAFCWETLQGSPASVTWRSTRFRHFFCSPTSWSVWIMSVWSRAKSNLMAVFICRIHLEQGMMQIQPHSLYVIYSSTSVLKAMPALANMVRVKYLQEQIYIPVRGHYKSHSDLQNYKNDIKTSA